MFDNDTRIILRRIFGVLVYVVFFLTTETVGYVKNKELYCKVSSHYYTPVDHHYRYPMEMFPEGSLSDQSELPLYYECSSRNFYKGSDQYQKCVVGKTLCPITHENLQTAIQMVDWNQYVEALSFMKHTKKIISTPKESKINVIFLGGSMTHGSLSFSACICNYDIDHRCPKRNYKPIDTECSWPTMLSAWLQKRFPEINFNFLDFATTGFTSMTMADTFGDYMRKTSPGLYLTSKDIVFIDHSVNDYFQSKIQIEQGMECLIRRVLKYSQQIHTNISSNSTVKPNIIYSKPTIIVIEQYPQLKTTTARSNSIENLPDYCHVYRSLSKHYELMFLSMREVFWSYYKYTNISMIVMEDSKNMEEQRRGKQRRVQKTISVRQYAKDPLAIEKSPELDIHPPWFVHLYIADLIADVLIHTMSSITIQAQHPAVYTHNVMEKKFLYDTADAMVSMVSALPPSLHQLDTLGVCDNNAPFFIDAHPNNSFTPSDVYSYEQDASSEVGQTGWREYVDYHGVAGWIINSLSEPTMRVLSFPMTSSAAHHSLQAGLLLKIMYLKSYKDMGRAYVNICDRSIYCHPSVTHCGIDGLYSDYETNKLSLPEIFLYVLQEQDAIRCAKLSPSQRSVSFEYATIQQGDRRTSSSDVLSLSVRGLQKVKLISVALCTMTSD